MTGKQWTQGAGRLRRACLTRVLSIINLFEAKGGNGSGRIGWEAASPPPDLTLHLLRLPRQHSP